MCSVAMQLQLLDKLKQQTVDGKLIHLKTFINFMLIIVSKFLIFNTHI